MSNGTNVCFVFVLVFFVFYLSLSLLSQELHYIILYIMVVALFVVCWCLFYACSSICMAERELSTELSVKTRAATDIMITTQLEWNIKVAAQKEEGINVSKYKRKHGWINLKKIASMFWKLVSLTVFSKFIFVICNDLYWAGKTYFVCQSSRVNS